MKTQIPKYRHHGPSGPWTLCTEARQEGRGTSPTLTHTGILPCRPPGSDTASGGHPGLAGTPRHTRGSSRESWGRGRSGHSGTAARTLARSPSLRHRPGPESAPELPGGSALCHGAGPTHLDEIKAGQEGDAVLDHFALWPLLRRHAGRLPVCASSPGRGVHRAAEASCLLQPQAPGAADVTFPAGTAGTSALRAAPPPPPAPLCSNPAALGARRSPSSLL